MHEVVREMMTKVYPKLSPDEQDDIESSFNNIEVLFQQCVEEASEPGWHVPAIELHVGVLTDLFMQAHDAIMSDIMNVGVEETEKRIKRFVYDYFKGCVLFGKKIGEVHWPVKVYKCEEVHPRHD